MKFLFCIFLFLLCEICLSQITPKIQWCAISDAELTKCNEVSSKIASTPLVLKYDLECVNGNGVFGCMELIYMQKADLMSMDMGLAYYGSLQYALRPVTVENYATSNLQGLRNVHHESFIVVPRGEPIGPTNLKGRQVCLSGVGTAEGWITPISQMIADQVIPITQCNSLVETITDFFDISCAPGALEEPFNIFGDNTDGLCKRCASQSDSRIFCSYRDAYAWSQGALRCLHGPRSAAGAAKVAKLPTMAFVRSGEIELAAADGDFPVGEYELFCPTVQVDGTYRAQIPSDVNKTTGCSWGKIQSNVIMAYLTTPSVKITFYRAFFADLIKFFTPLGGTSFTGFNLFSSNITGIQLGNENQKSPSRHLMFSDTTQNFYSPPEEESSTYYQLAEPQFVQKIDKLNTCPIADVRWCVISQDEMRKCQKMKSALDAKKIKPGFNCILGGSTISCMRYISQGYADMITLDAADLYVAGTKFGLVPIAAENYGDQTGYYAVAIVHKTNKYLAISSLKNQRTCHSGVGMATGWVVPMNVVLETKQINVYKGNLLHAFSELVSRACIPGLLNDDYNPNGFNSLNLCETCAAGGQWKCQRDSRENYYGDSGAFRCLIEGGDVAFAKHTTVRENTGGRNPVHWARNRRSDDYELLCSDGSRGSVVSWKTCNLGWIPGNTVVTAKHKTEVQREALWRLLRYAQSEYSSDANDVFSMFKSTYGRNDLMFSDSAVNLKWIPFPNQTYKGWLGKSFIRQVENLYELSSWGESGMYSQATPAPGLSASTSLALTLVCLAVNFLLVRNRYT